MYQSKFRPRHGQNRSRQFGGNRRFSGNRQRFSRSNRGGSVNVERYINKAVEPVAAEVYVPKYKFEDFNIDPRLKQAIVAKGYTTPTPIQDQTIPYMLEGQDILGMANTGTGKTAAFLIPLINKVLKNHGEKVLIIAPTRELALQTQDELKILTRNMNIMSVLCIGGANIMGQIRFLRNNPNFVIGTPGRLKDLYQQRVLNLGSFRSVVLDEVDCMFDMGFIKDITFLMELLPQTRQTLFFSATLPAAIAPLTQRFLKNPKTVSVKTRDTASAVSQDIIRVKDKSRKVDQLFELLTQKECKKVLVFGRTKHGVKKLEQVLNDRGLRAGSIHGNKTQSQRQKALQAFRQDHVSILVATDVAARGLDIPNVTHVINYDVPETYEDYIHRIGRTGRADKTGQAFTFID